MTEIANRGTDMDIIRMCTVLTTINISQRACFFVEKIKEIKLIQYIIMKYCTQFKKMLSTMKREIVCRLSIR